MAKHRNKVTLPFIALGTLISMGLVFWGSSKIQNNIKYKEGLANDISKDTSIKESIFEVVSPDGKYILTLNNKEYDLVHQTIVLKNVEDNSEKLILEKTSTYNDLLSIPLNSFSPDNKYIFLKEGKGETSEYLVLRTDDKNLNGNIRTVEITKLFNEIYSDFTISDVTGWGGVGLIVVNTNYKSGKSGPSFWFDPSTFKFIRLNNRFN